MSNENPYYQSNALSRFFQKIGTKLSAVSNSIGDWLPQHYFRVIVALCLILVTPWLWLMFQIGEEIYMLIAGPIKVVTPDDHRNIAYALGVSITALAGLLAAPLIIVRAWIHERQTEVATRQAETAEQGLITDRFTKAVEQLGAEKTVSYHAAHRDSGELIYRELGEPVIIEETTPNLEVRLGAIYALERIAQDSERDHIPIMETLCAYIRENSHARPATTIWATGSPCPTMPASKTAPRIWNGGGSGSGISSPNRKHGDGRRASTPRAPTSRRR